MNEIRSLVNENSALKGKKSKSVRFLRENKVSAAADSGADSGLDSTSSNPREEVGQNRENWLQRMAEQRQLYYDNVNKLLSHMKNRQDYATRGDYKMFSRFIPVIL